MFKIMKNMGYAYFANIISILITIIVTFFLPKMISIEDYSYWQLYIFYASYIGFFHLGWIDGIYLRYAGNSYEELDKKKFSSQFWMLTFFESILTIILVIIVLNGSIDSKNIILFLTILNILLIIPKTFVQLLLQTTNRIQEYAKVTIIEKLFYIIFIFLAIFMGFKSFFPLIIAEILSKVIALVINLWFIKDIVIKKPNITRESFVEAKLNISVGSKLMIANTASMLILGVIKLGIEKNWNIIEFGKISLAISMSNILITFISMAGVVIFPAIKQIDNARLVTIYSKMRIVLMVFLFGLLMLYFPGKLILQKWLPEYMDSIKYMAFIFPLCIFDSKVSMLINTYLKALRKEIIMLVINIACVLLSVFFTIIFTFLYKNLDAIMISIVVVFAVRSIALEYVLAKYLKFSIATDSYLEISMVIGFIFVSINLKTLHAFLIYSMGYIIYLIIKKSDLIEIKQIILKIIRDRV